MGKQQPATKASGEQTAVRRIGTAVLPAGAADYFDRSRCPLASLVFVLPLLAMYEAGVLVMGPRALRNGADIWLRRLLDHLGFGQYFLLPLLTISLLLAWHHTTRDRWRISGPVLSGMLIESALWAFALLVLGHLQRGLSQMMVARPPAAALEALSCGPLSPGTLSFGTLSLGPILLGTGSWSPTARLIGFCGAGIYEEVLFRLTLLPAVSWLLGIFSAGPQARVAGAVVLTSLAFSAGHYVGAQGDTFEWFSFCFRALAGSFFALVFVYRGFGIVAGTHALYDIFVGLL